MSKVPCRVPECATLYYHCSILHLLLLLQCNFAFVGAEWLQSEVDYSWWAEVSWLQSLTPHPGSEVGSEISLQLVNCSSFLTTVTPPRSEVGLQLMCCSSLVCSHQPPPPPPRSEFWLQLVWGEVSWLHVPPPRSEIGLSAVGECFLTTVTPPPRSEIGLSAVGECFLTAVPPPRIRDELHSTHSPWYPMHPQTF